MKEKGVFNSFFSHVFLFECLKNEKKENKQYNEVN